MKKTLIAVAALAATSAFAQVSVYGRLDVGYANTKTTSGTTETKANGVESHNSASSMWGIKGTEDLGGGLKAFFQLEQDVYPANGNTGASGSGGGATNASGFNRTSLVGLEGSFGKIAFGRDYVPLFQLIGSTDVHAVSRISTVQQAGASGDTTAASQIVYTSPNMSGFVLKAAIINDDNSTNTVAGTDKYKATHLTGVYTNGPLMVGAGVATTKDTSGTTEDKIEGTAIAAGYDFGTFSLKGGYTTRENSTNGTTTNELSELNIGAVVPMGKVKLTAQYGQNTREATGIDSDGNDFVVGAEYALSAKTALFAKTGTFNKLDASGAQVDQKTTSTAVGIRTVF